MTHVNIPLTSNAFNDSPEILFLHIYREAAILQRNPRNLGCWCAWADSTHRRICTGSLGLRGAFERTWCLSPKRRVGGDMQEK